MTVDPERLKVATEAAGRYVARLMGIIDTCSLSAREKYLVEAAITALDAHNQPENANPMTTKFQQRHYNAVADVIRSTVNNGVSGEQYAMHKLARALASMFARDNPNFKREAFYSAAEVKGYE
jgi:hypothetical protein